MSVPYNPDAQQSFISWVQQASCLKSKRSNQIAVIDAFVKSSSEKDQRGLPVFNNARFIELCTIADIWGDSLDKVILIAQKCFHHPRIGLFFHLTMEDGAIGRHIEDKATLKRIRMSFSSACTDGGRLEMFFRDLDAEEHKRTISPQSAQDLRRAAASSYSEDTLVDVYRDTKLFAEEGYTNRRGETIFPNVLSESYGMKKGTVLDAEPLPLGPPIASKRTQLLIVNQDSIDAALDPKNALINPCVLNLANAFSPGGGVEYGSIAQEEDIFRRTNSFECLYPERNPKLAVEIQQYQSTMKGVEMEKSRPAMGAGHNRDNYLIPEHGGIYSPNVCVFRRSVETGFDLMDQPSLLSFVAVAAYNRKSSHKSKLVFGNADYGPTDAATYREYTKRKLRAILRIAAIHGHDDLVLGAFGCGAFKNDPKNIAHWFGEVLIEEEFKNRFRTIVFAILERGEPRNLTAFETDPILRNLREEGKDIH